jgi:benzoylformate decarboxylase
MRELLGEYLDGHLTRRGFLQSLVAAGFTASAARSVVRAAEIGGSEHSSDTAPGSYRIHGTAGDLLAEQIKAAGTKYIFTNPGSVEVAFFDALTDRPELFIIMGLHEGVVLSMADGYHKVSQKPAVVNVHAVAGTGQIGGQMFNVHRDGSSLVITAGLNDTTVFSDDMHLAPRPGFNQRDINQQFTKLSWEVRNAASAAVATRRAFKLAATAPGGPVYVAYSRNALAEKASGEIFPGEKFLIQARPRPAADKLETLARLLIEAERPAMLFGDEVWKSGAQASAVELAELLGLAAATGQQCFGNFPTAHPQYVGSLRSGSDRPYPFGNYDLLVQMGARDPGGSSIPESIRPADRFVGVGMDTGMLGRTMPIDLAIVADVNVTLKELADAVKSLVAKDRLQKIRAERLDVVTRAVAEAKATREADAQRNFNQDPIHPDRLDYELAKAVDKHAIVAMETLSSKDDFMNYGYREDEKMRLWSNGTSLGWGVGSSIGAQLAAPDRQVVLSIGDGSLMYSASGFWTQARYDIPVLTVVWNNRNYQTVRLGFNRYGGRMAATGHYHGMYLGDPDIDYVGLAASQGVGGIRVNSVSELEGALRKGVQTTLDGKPFLIDVGISRIGGGADSTWHRDFKLTDQRKMKA